MSFDIASATLKRITNCEIGVQREFVWPIWFTVWYFSFNLYMYYLSCLLHNYASKRTDILFWLHTFNLLRTICYHIFYIQYWQPGPIHPGSHWFCAHWPVCGSKSEAQCNSSVQSPLFWNVLPLVCKQNSPAITCCQVCVLFFFVEYRWSNELTYYFERWSYMITEYTVYNLQYNSLL